MALGLLISWLTWPRWVSRGTGSNLVLRAFTAGQVHAVSMVTDVSFS